MVKWLLLLCCLAVSSAMGEASWALELESGLRSTGRADVRIPGDAGTRFSLVDDLDASDTGYWRVRFSRRSAPRHNWIASIVPIDVSASGRLESDTIYVDTLFAAGTEVDATYRFNNYRLTYRYLLRETARFRIEVGATLFVRDAKVTLRSATEEASDADLGFVPLASFAARWQVLPRISLLVDGDALAAPQGRALDVFSGLHYQPRDNLSLGAGYRILEGGADNDAVYTFALFHHAAVQAIWRF